MKQVGPHHAPIVDKAAHILDTLAANDPGMSLADLVAQLGLPKSTVYRILNSLGAYGLIAKEDGGRLYRLGPRISELARAASPRSDRTVLINAAAPVMDAVSQMIGEACKLSVLDGNESVSVRVSQSPAEYGLMLRTGHRAALHAGGSSKAILAHLPPADIERIVHGRLTTFTPFTITDPDMLMEALDLVRAQGFAEDNFEVTLGIRSAAAPIFAPSGQVVGALGVPYLGDPVPERVRAIRKVVVEGARTIELTMGGGAQVRGHAGSISGSVSLLT